MQRSTGITSRFQPLGQFSCGGFGADKHQSGVHVLDFQNPVQRIKLVQAADLPVTLINGSHRRRASLNLDFLRIAQMAVRHPANRFRHGGGKQRDLPLRRGALQNPVHIVNKTHPQHFIGFVQHHAAQVVETQGFPAQMIHDPARRPDDDMGAAPQMAQLNGHALAAVNRQYMKAGQMTGVILERFRDLNRQLAGGRQHQNLRMMVG